MTKVTIGATSTVAFGMSDTNPRSKRDILLSNLEHLSTMKGVTIQKFDKTTHITVPTQRDLLTYIVKN